MKIVHGSPGFGSILTEEQTIKFLTDKKLNLLLGTVDKNGDPFIHPVWFLYENEKLYVETSKTSKKVQNIHHSKIQYTFVSTMKIFHTLVYQRKSFSENIN